MIFKKSLLIALLSGLIGFSTISAQAASVNVEACLTATVVEQLPDLNVINAGAPLCALLEIIVVASNPGEILSETDSVTEFEPIWGGVNDSGVSVNYTIQYDWTFEVVVDLINEFDHAKINISFPSSSYTFIQSDSGSDMLMFSGVIDPGMAIDGFETIQIGATVISAYMVPVPAMLVPFLLCVVGLARLKKRKIY